MRAGLKSKEEFVEMMYEEFRDQLTLRQRFEGCEYGVEPSGGIDGVRNAWEHHVPRVLKIFRRV